MATDYSEADNAETYSEGLISDESTLHPVILDVVGDVGGKTLLDIGCGSGKYSIVFADRGADVTGVDISEDQIRLAEKIHPHESITYMAGEAPKLLDHEQFDLTFMNMVVPDVDSPGTLRDLFALARKVTKERFIFTTLHPFYLCPPGSELDRPGSDFDAKNYFNEGITYPAKAITKQGNDMHFNETHYSLSFVSKLLAENDFCIKQLYESRPVPERNTYLPIYLVFECVVR